VEHDNYKVFYIIRELGFKNGGIDSGAADASRREPNGPFTD
jgi:hypothetical protein